MDPRSPFTLEYPAREAGLQRWDWDLHADDLPCRDGHFIFEGYGGPAVAPGTYTVRVAAGTAVATTDVEVLPDPRVDADSAAIRSWVDMQTRIAGDLAAVVVALDAARSAREQVRNLQRTYEDASLQRMADAAIDAIDAWEQDITELRHETFEDEDAWVMKLDGQLRHLLDVVEDSGAPVTAGARERYADLTALWNEKRQALQAISVGQLRAINDWASRNAVPQVRPPIGAGPD
jgi:hypothetical protein